MFKESDKFTVNPKISWRNDRLGKKRIILIEVPQTHSIYILEKLESMMWKLFIHKKTFREIVEIISNKLGRDAKKDCEKFIEDLIEKNLLLQI